MSFLPILMYVSPRGGGTTNIDEDDYETIVVDMSLSSVQLFLSCIQSVPELPPSILTCSSFKRIHYGRNQHYCQLTNVPKRSMYSLRAQLLGCNTMAEWRRLLCLSILAVCDLCETLSVQHVPISLDSIRVHPQYRFLVAPWSMAPSPFESLEDWIERTILNDMSSDEYLADTAFDDACRRYTDIRRLPLTEYRGLIKDTLRRECVFHQVSVVREKWRSNVRYTERMADLFSWLVALSETQNNDLYRQITAGRRLSCAEYKQRMWSALLDPEKIVWRKESNLDDCKAALNRSWAWEETDWNSPL